ncbi:hypothetical protein [Tsukamurella pseudospumae]|uniref:hypothetical protein n=1 Tax=Tsukamurella pseudospumae TaxID=239498 RepID=UPI000A7A2BB5|nr:hypothetical protein [Tsukamurella pseudospumae]
MSYVIRALGKRKGWGNTEFWGIAYWDRQEGDWVLHSEDSCNRKAWETEDLTLAKRMCNYLNGGASEPPNLGR